MKIKTLNDEMLKRYLLDDVSDEERREIEEQFFVDDELFETMNALEDELFFDYRQKRFNAKEQAAFEQKFLQTPKEKEKAAFADIFLQTTAELAESETEPKVSFWQPLFNLFKSFGSPLEFGLAAAAILMLFGISWLFYQNAQMQTELADWESNRAREMQKQEQIIAEKQLRQAELENRLLAEKQKAEQNENQLLEMEKERKRLEREIADLRQRQTRTPSATNLPKTPVAPPQRSIIAVVLSPGLFSRSGGEGMKKVNLPASAKNLNLRLLIETGETYKSFRAIVKTINEGAEIWSKTNLKAVGKGKQRSLSINIPANILQRADYELILSGTNENGELEEIDSYYFSVLK